MEEVKVEGVPAQQQLEQRPRPMRACERGAGQLAAAQVDAGWAGGSFSWERRGGVWGEEEPLQRPQKRKGSSTVGVPLDSRAGQVSPVDSGERAPLLGLGRMETLRPFTDYPCVLGSERNQT